MSAKHAAFRLASRLNRIRRGSTIPPGIRALLYHSVGTRLPSDPYGTSINKEAFHRHLERYESLRPRFPSRPFQPTSSDSPAAAFTFDDGYRDTLTVAAPLLVERAIPFTVFVAATHVDAPGGLYLSRAELRTLANLPGAAIGAHGDRHIPLAELEDRAMREELRGSKRRLEDWIGRPVLAMSYPFGSVDRRVRDAAAEAGFKFAGCSLYGSNAPDRDPMLLKRTEIVAWDSPDDFEAKLCGDWDWFALRQGDPAR